MRSDSTTAKTLSLASATLLATLLAAAAVAPSVAADHNPQTADTLAPGTYTESIDFSGDEDWFRLIAPVLTKVEVSVTPDCSNGTVDADLELYEGDGTTLISADTAGTCETKTVHCWTNANQQLFARVFDGGADTGDYQITHTQTAYTGSSLGTLPSPLCMVD